jgi:hypothetical protein
MLASLLFLPHAGLVRALDLGMDKAHVHYLLPKSRVKDHLDAARKPRVLVRMVKYHTPFIGTMTLLTLTTLSISFLDPYHRLFILHSLNLVLVGAHRGLDVSAYHPAFWRAVKHVLLAPERKRVKQYLLVLCQPVINSYLDRHLGVDYCLTLLVDYSCKLLFFLNILLRHVKLLLLHAEVTHPKLEAEPYERGYGVVVYDTEPVALMHHRYYLILKLVVNCRAAYHLPFDVAVVVVRRIGTSTTRHIFFYSILSIYSTEFKLCEYTYDIMISRFFRRIFVTKINGRFLVCMVVQCSRVYWYIIIGRSHELLQYDDMALQACIVDSALVSHSNFDPFLISRISLHDIII